MYLVFGNYHSYETKMSVVLISLDCQLNQIAVAEIECGLFLQGKFMVGNNNKSALAQTRENAHSESLVLTP